MKKYLPLIFIQILFFVLLFFRNWFFKENPILNNTLYIGILLGLSFFIFQCFYKYSNAVKGYVINLISLFILFELMKYITFKSGFTPKYIETLLISAIFSFVAISIYLGIIFFLVYFVKRLERFK